MAYVTLLPATTSAAYSSTFAVPNDGSSVTITSNGYGSDTSTEYAQLQIYDFLTESWYNVLNNDEIPTLNSQSNFINITQNPATYRFYKTTTASAVGMTLTSEIVVNTNNYSLISEG